MPAAILRADENAAHDALTALEVLDPEREAEFDALVRAAALACEAPIALISLVDVDRLRFKAAIGWTASIAMTGPARDAWFCAHAVATGELLEVADATSDPRFTDHPLVREPAGLRFYAGVPLQLAGGERIGTLCVIDRVPRQLTPTHRAILRELARAATCALERRHATADVRATALKLAASEARFRSLTEGSPLGVFQADAEGRCTYANPTLQTLFGLGFEDCLAWGWARSVHPLDRGTVLREWQARTHEGQIFDADVRLLRPDRSLREVRLRSQPLVDAAGRVIGHVGSVADVTRHNQLEAALRQTGRLAGVGGWELDLRTDKLSWSDQTRVIHDVGEDHEPTLADALAFYPGRAGEAMAAAVRAAIEEGKPWDLEVPFTSATGRFRWIRAMGEVELENARPVRLIGAVQDVTEHHDRQLALLSEQAARREIERHARKTEALLKERSDMLDVLAHEVRQPLNNASAALQGAAMAMAEKGGDRAASSTLSKAQDVLGQVLSRIDNNLAVASLLARPEPIQPHDAEVDILLSLAHGDMPAQARARIRLVRETATRTVSMDIGLMRLALRNLLANALQYSPPGSPVELRLADSDEPLALLIDVVSQGGPIAEAALPRLFERGAKPGRGGGGAHGMGLGLYIVRRVMELQGGRVDLLENAAGRVAFRLTLVQPADA